MHIRYAVPGAMRNTASGPAELQRRQAMLANWAAPDTTVTITDAPSGPLSIETTYDGLLCVPFLVEALAEAERDDVDAIIVGCFDDPAVDALRELAVRTAVVGPAMASVHMAAMLGRAIGIVSVPEVAGLYRLLASYSMSNHIADIAVLDSTVLGLRDDRDATAAKVKAAARQLTDSGADVIVYGCMSLAFLDLDAEVEDAAGVPVVNPARTALAVATAMVQAGLMPSKRAYPSPVRTAANGMRHQPAELGRARPT
jgi:allantoin racemase